MNDSKTPVIMFDGPDGVGKTTQLSLVKQAAESKGLKVYNSRMLGGTPFGEALRQAIFVSEYRTPTSDLHVALAMAHTLAADLEVKKANFDLILIDRSPLSVLAFQVAGSGLDELSGQQGCEQELAWLKPALICVYEADQEKLQHRLPTRSLPGRGDYFEDQNLDYHLRVAASYKHSAERYPEIVEIINANSDAHSVFDSTLSALRKRLNIELQEV